MEKINIKKDFNELNLTDRALEHYEFEECNFTGSDFTSAKLHGCVFDRCTFNSVILSATGLKNTKFTECKFRNCKLLGLEWSEVSSELGFRLDCEKCDLSYSRFYNLEMPSSKFSSCKFNETEFERCNLKHSEFIDSDFTKSTFVKCDLRESDFSESKNYYFDPSSNRLKGAKFTYPDALGLLSYFGIKVE